MTSISKTLKVHTANQNTQQDNVACVFEYDSEDPYAVIMNVWSEPDDGYVEWQLARGLFIEAARNRNLRKSYPASDVAIMWGSKFVIISVAMMYCPTQIMVSGKHLEGFIAQTLRLVPEGTEAHHGHVSEELDEFLDSLS